MEYRVLPLVILLTLTGCNETQEKESDPSLLLNESVNKLPPSTLIEADKKHERYVLEKAPNLNAFEKLTATVYVKDPDFGFAITGLEWSADKTIIFAQIAGGTIRYDTYRKGYGCGLFSCDGYSTIDERMRIDSDIDDNSFYMREIASYPREYQESYKEKGKDGSEIEKLKTSTRSKIKLPTIDYKETKYSLVFDAVPYESLRQFDVYTTYCSSSDNYKACDISIKYFDQELQEQESVLAYLKSSKIDLISVNAIKELYKKYSKYDKVKDLLVLKIFSRLKQKNSIIELHEFNSAFQPHKEVVEKSIEALYKLTKIKDSVAGYEWFITHYSNSKYSKSALERIHEIMFEKAQKVDTIAAYNSFVFSYPTAKQVEKANEVANDKERRIYTNLGILSFWDTDHKKEKKSRKFLIKAKQIERFPRDNDLRGNRKSGYLIVADRMYKLLQEEFDESDATLRHLESQEFKDFVSDFKSVMSNIRYTLEKIEGNTNKMSRYSEEMVSVSRKGFSDAKADRAMAAYHEKKKTEWDKFMHLRDKGYN
ncbi:hypothetical protein CWC15_18150 [Pseudoalteromonas spongiae]|nr:hypothetical protein CWC15_18150 [Pseudoalteromonas spongiae]